MFIALREIRESRGRFALLTGAVALLVLLLLFFQAVAGSLTLGLTGGVEQSGSDIWVYDDRARNNPALSVVGAGVADTVAGVDGVAQAGPIGLSVFVADSKGSEVEVVLLGGDTTGPAGPRELSDGDRPSAAGEAIYSGASLSGDGFDLGDELEVAGQAITVVGIADVPASIIGVQVEEGADADEVTSRIEREVEGVTALTTSDAVDALPGVGTITQSFDILYLLLYIVVTMVTGVFFLILTVQKAQSLVLLRAIGASKLDVVKPVLIEVVFVTGVGSVVGSAVAWGLLWLLRDVFGAQLGMTTVLISIGAVVLLGFVASIGALRRVFAIDPMGATRTGGVQV
jgi:putative ABC transport system permease protein